MQNNADYQQTFENYRWKLFEIMAIEAELAAIRRQIDEGIASRDQYDPQWENELTAELETAKAQIKLVEDLIASIPDSPKMMPCKLFLRLHYLAGYNMTDTAVMMNVSLSTLRRIKERSIEFLSS